MQGGAGVQWKKISCGSHLWVRRSDAVLCGTVLGKASLPRGGSCQAPAPDLVALGSVLGFKTYRVDPGMATWNWEMLLLRGVFKMEPPPES